jgi:hypothetical protein
MPIEQNLNFLRRQLNLTIMEILTIKINPNAIFDNIYIRIIVNANYLKLFFLIIKIKIYKNSVLTFARIEKYWSSYFTALNQFNLTFTSI